MTAKIFDMGKYLSRRRETVEYLEPPDSPGSVLDVYKTYEQSRNEMMKACSEAVVRKVDDEILSGSTEHD